MAEVDAATTDAVKALRGGNPGPVIATLDQIKQPLALAAQSLATAKQHIENTTDGVT